VLIIVMMIVTLLLVALTAALPSVYQEGQREREEELIFRGKQYARAVALFHRQFNRYPVSIKELMGTNNMRFLRQEYRDPVDPKGAWRFIHANAAGVLIDSVNQPISSNLANPNNPTAGADQNASSGVTSSGTGAGQTGFQSSFGGMGQPGLPTGLGQTTSPSSSSFFGSGNDIQGAFIVGVAPTSRAKPIRNCNKKQHYNQWEFLGLDMGMFGTQAAMTCFSFASPGVAQQPSQQTPNTPPNPVSTPNPTPSVGPASFPPDIGAPSN